MSFKEKIAESYQKAKDKLGDIKEKKTFVAVKEKISNFKFGKVDLEKLKKIKFDKKTKIILAFSLALLVLLSYSITVKVNSKSYTIKKIYNALEKNDSKDLGKLLTIEGTDKKLSEEQIKPIMEFYSSNKGRIAELTSALNSDKEIYSMKLTSEDGFLGNNYGLTTNYKELTIKTDFEDATLSINGVTEGVINKEKKVSLIAPGVYKIKLDYKGKDASLTNEKEITLTENQEVEMKLNGIKVSVKSNYENANILINDKDTAVKAKDFLNKGPFPTDGSYKISMKYNTPWGEIKSEEVPITNNPEIHLNLELKNESLKTQLEPVMEKFYNSVFLSLNNGNKEDITGTTKEVKDKIYDILNEKYFLFKNIYKLESLEVDLNKSKITFENNQYKGNIVTSVNYLIKKDMLGIPLKSKSVTQNFFIEVVYKNGAWVISNVENFTLES